MIKLFFLFLISLFSFAELSAQVVDSAVQEPVAVKKDTVVRRDTTVRKRVRTVKGDSARRADSIRLATRRADSLRMAAGSVDPGRVAGTGAGGTTGVVTGAGGTAAVAAADSMRRDSVRGAAANAAAGAGVMAPRKDAGPAAMVFWNKVMGSCPYFNFLGKPVVEPFQVHRAGSKDTLFYLMLGILFFFALTRIAFEKYFGNLMTLFFRVSLRQQAIREQVLQTPLPSLLLNILFIITGGLYAAYLLIPRLGGGVNFWILYADCIAGLAVIYLVKFVILKFCGWVFNISRATDTYIFIVFLVNKMVGIFLLPLLIVITFSGQEVREIFITISFVMIFVLLAYRVFAAYRPVRNEIKLTPFHFFLYLCAFEIAPLLLIYKVLLSYLEKVY